MFKLRELLYNEAPADGGESGGGDGSPSETNSPNDNYQKDSRLDGNGNPIEGGQ